MNSVQRAKSSRSSSINSSFAVQCADNLLSMASNRNTEYSDSGEVESGSSEDDPISGMHRLLTNGGEVADVAMADGQISLNNVIVFVIGFATAVLSTQFFTNLRPTCDDDAQVTAGERVQRKVTQYVLMNGPPSSSSAEWSFSAKWTDDLLAVASNDRWSDIVIKVKGKEFACHKVILDARCPYFQEKLKTGGQQMKVIIERKGTADAFEVIRKYIYTGVVKYEHLEEEQVANILTLSKKYKLDELTNYMTDQVKKRITAANVVKIFRLMSGIQHHSLVDECLEFIKSNANCFNSDEFNNLKMKNVVQLFKVTNISDETQYALIKKWVKNNQNENPTKLFNMLDDDRYLEEGSDEDHSMEDDLRAKQYLLINGNGGETVILHPETFVEVARMNLPETKDSGIAVSNGIFYVINLARGEVLSTHVLNLLRSESIAWDTCVSFPSASWSRGNTIAIGDVIYLNNVKHLYAFDTKRKLVEKFDKIGEIEYHSLVEFNGLIYSRGATGLQSTDRIGGWTAIDLPSSISPPPLYPALVKMQDSICILGGRTAAYTCLDFVSCCNTKSKSWSTIDPMNESKCAPATVELDGKGTIVVGGNNGREWLDSISLLDKVSKKWVFVPYKLPYKLQYPQAVTFYA